MKSTEKILLSFTLIFVTIASTEWFFKAISFIWAVTSNYLSYKVIAICVISLFSSNIAFWIGYDIGKLHEPIGTKSLAACSLAVGFITVLVMFFIF